MIRSIFQSCRACQLGRWFGAVLLLACIGLPGCNSMGFREDQLQYDPALELGPARRPPLENSDFFGVSNKARQIERNCAR